MKIIIITNGLFPVPAVKGGGAETLVQNILDQNEIYHKADFVVYSVYDSNAINASKKYAYSEFRFIEKKKWTLKDLGYLCKHFYKKIILNFTTYRYIYDFDLVLKEIKNINFDYIVIENTLVPFEKFVEAFSTKVYVHIHNELFKPTYNERQREEYGKLINNCAGIITVSDYIKQYSLQMGTADKGKFHVLLNSVDVKRFRRDPVRLNSKYDALSSKFTFVYFGRICDEKGVLELVNAFRRLTSPDVSLLIIGGFDLINSKYANELKNVIEKDNRIVTTGYINHDDLWMYLKISRCAVLPSKWADPCPLTIIESMAAGLPIISTNTGGIPEEVDDNCAMLLESNDNLETNLFLAMKKISSDDKLYNRMSASAEKRVEVNGFFDLKSYYDRFIEIIERGT